MRAGIVAGDVLVFQAQHLGRHPQQDVLGVVDAQPADDKVLRLDDVGGVLESRLDVGAGEIDARSRLIGDKLIGTEIDPARRLIAGRLPGGAGEIADDGAVLRGDLAKKVRANQSACAVHVLHDDARRAFDVPLHELGEQPAFHVGGAAGCVIDQNRQPLTLVEILLRRSGPGKNPDREQRADGRHKATLRDRHGVLREFVTASPTLHGREPQRNPRSRATQSCGRVKWS